MKRIKVKLIPSLEGGSARIEMLDNNETIEIEKMHDKKSVLENFKSLIENIQKYYIQNYQFRIFFKI